jgi:hypothetical protein
MIVVASVPHSATRFVIEHLLDGECFHRHLDAECIPALRAQARNHPLIIPLRHPRDVALSWKARRRPLPSLPPMYRAMVTAFDPLRPLYLPVDHRARDDYLEQVNAMTGLRLRTDWPIWKSLDLRGRFDGTDAELVDDMIAELAGFFVRFGYA